MGDGTAAPDDAPAILPYKAASSSKFFAMSRPLLTRDTDENEFRLTCEIIKSGSLRDFVRASGVSLQDAYEILLHKGDPLGERFADLGWNGCKSPLLERNNSIGGHGFKPVSPEVSGRLWEGALSLAGISEPEVFRFPKLGAT